MREISAVLYIPVYNIYIYIRTEVAVRPDGEREEDEKKEERFLFRCL